MIGSLLRTATSVANAVVSRTRKYNGSWSTPHPDLLSGLVAMTFSLRTRDESMPVVRLFVRLNDHEHEVPVVISRNRANAQIAAHSHLLPNGPNTLAMRFESEQGDALWSEVVAVNVVNDSALAARVRASLIRKGAPVIVDAVIDSSDYDFADDALTPWFDRPDAQQHIEHLESIAAIRPDEATALRQFVEEGYLVLEGLIDDELIDAVNQEIDRAIAAKYQGYEYGTSQRIEKLHHLHPNIRKLWLDARYLRMVDLIFDATARPCQTLTYVFGSQQTAHQDSAFLTPFPAGYMCGTWIALEDIVQGSGELVIYPGSHRTPRPRMADLQYSREDKKANRNTMSPQGAAALERHWVSQVAAFDAKKVVYRPKRGTVLIWHENLIHAGSTRIDESQSRRSMVIHSFADGAISFFDHSGHVGYTVPKEYRTSARGEEINEVLPSY